MQYSSIWIIDGNGFGDIVELYDVSADLGLILLKKGITTDEDYSGLKLFIEVSNKDEFLEFAEKGTPIFQRLSLTEWELVPEGEEEEHLFEKPVRISEFSGNMYNTFYGSFLYAIKHNERLRNGDQPKWL